MNLLFVCTHNRCRSILAEAIANQLGGEHLRARSAGSRPADKVHPLTLAYLQERGIPTTNLYSKSWNEISDSAPDIVVTVCDQAAGEDCPLWLGAAEKVHWGLADPSALERTEAQRRDAFHATIDTLASRLQAVVADISRGATTEDVAERMRLRS